MAGQKDTYCLQLRHEAWTDFAIRHGHGTAQEYLHIFEYEKRLRHECHATQWIQVQAGDESEYFMSFSPKNLGIDGTMCFPVEDEFEVLFVERPKKKPGETREPRDLRGWQATLIETDCFYHTGSHLALIRRPMVGLYYDKAAIPVGAPPDKWSAEIPYHPAYFKLRESTVKARIQTINLMDPRNKTIARANGLNTEEGDEFVDSDDDFGERILDWDDDQAPQDFDTPLSDNGRDSEEAFVSTRPPFDFETQRAILLGSAVAKETSKDFTCGLSEDKVRHYLRLCTPKSREGLVRILPRVPGGVLLSVGAAGCGKTSHVLEIVFLNLDNGCVAFVEPTTNAAMNSGCDRFQETLRKHEAQGKYLAPRLRAEWLEISAVLRFRSDAPQELDNSTNYTNASSNPKRGSKCLFAMSAAKGVLQMVALIPTKNAKLI
jgi:hypothetical protein